MTRTKRRTAPPDAEHIELVNRALSGDVYIPIANQEVGNSLRARLFRTVRWLKANDPENAELLKNYRTNVHVTGELQLLDKDYIVDYHRYPYTLVLTCLENKPIYDIGPIHLPQANPEPRQTFRQYIADVPFHLDELDTPRPNDPAAAMSEILNDLDLDPEQ